MGSTTDHERAVLLTGATGFLGMELLARYLRRTKKPLFALVRGRDDDEATTRLRAAARTMLPDADEHADRLTAVRGDASAPDLGLDSARREQLAERVGEIVHSAASVSFSLPIEQARSINVGGTRHMLELAELCERRGGLRHFSHVSTAYVAGSHRGAFGEDDLDVGQRFHNSYERSKWEAERLVRERSGSLPVSVFRPSIVVGEEDTGWTPAFNVIYGPLRAYAKGALHAVPARRSSLADVVPASYVADSVFELSERPPGTGATYTLAAGSGANTVGELMDMSAAAFGRRRALPVPPRLYRRLVHPLLLRRSSGARRRVLQRSEVFFPYFALGVRYDTSRADAALAPAGITTPRLPDYFGRLVEFALAAEWGRKPLRRADLPLRPGERAPLARDPAAGC
jgi:thioester reductase-like protein